MPNLIARAGRYAGVNLMPAGDLSDPVWRALAYAVADAGIDLANDENEE